MATTFPSPDSVRFERIREARAEAEPRLSTSSRSDEVHPERLPWQAVEGLDTNGVDNGANGSGYGARRDALETYFDRTARKAWEDLTSDAPVSRIRATVRAGRERMRGTLLSWLPDDLRRKRVLDAGCGTGALATELAWRGAEVVAIDVAAGLVDVARARAPSFLGHGSIDWRVGDMLDPALGEFDHVVAMDSLIHYGPDDIAATVAALAARTRATMVFTFAPRTPALTLMHAAGKLFPRADRAPAIVPVGPRALQRRLDDLRLGRTTRIAGGFYVSQALEVARR